MLCAESPAWLGSGGSHPAAGADGEQMQEAPEPPQWPTEGSALTLFFQEPLNTQDFCQPSPLGP